MYHYKNLEDRLDYTMLTYPITLNDVDKFERKNNISINVIGRNKSGAYIPMRPTKIINAIKEIVALCGNKRFR